MRPVVLFALLFFVVARTPEQPEATTRGEPTHKGAGQMAISRGSERQPTQGPADYFTGTATITPLFT